MTAPYRSYIHEYYDQMQTGQVTVGKWIRLLYDKIVNGLRDGLFYFDEKKANKAIKFIENFCRHCEGRNDLIKLELWQKALLSALYYFPYVQWLIILIFLIFILLVCFRRLR